MKTLLYFTCFCITSFGAISPARAAADGSERMNVLLIMVDDLKPTLGAYGDDVAQTPNMDQLAESGLLFERTVCQVSICGPSRASLLTGLRPETIDCYINSDQFRKAVPDAVTLPQAFEQEGYATISIGKVFDARNRDPGGWTEEWMKSNEKHIYALEENRQLYRDNEKRFQAASLQERQKLWRVGPAVESAGSAIDHWDGQIADLAINKMRQYRDQPFFLAVGFIKPHLPFSAPQEFWDLYDPATLPMPWQVSRPKDALPLAYHDGFELRQYHGIPKKGVLDDDLAQELVHGYYACTSFVDFLVGKLLDELDVLGLRDRTLIVLMGDHGFHLGEKEVWCKFTSFQEAARVPLIVVDPRMSNGGKRTAALSELIDIYPTLCELAGVPAPEDLEGQSLAPLLITPEQEFKNEVFTVSGRGRGWKEYIGTSMFDGTFNYIEWRNRTTGKLRARELYDFVNDPWESANIIDDPKYKSQLERLEERMTSARR